MGPERTVFSAPVSTTKSWNEPSLTFARIDDLVVHQPEVDGVDLLLGARVHVERHALAERPEELDLGPRPVGLLAVILVRQQVDVVAERAGGFLVLVHPLVDRADRVVDLEVARRQVHAAVCASSSARRAGSAQRANAPGRGGPARGSGWRTARLVALLRPPRTGPTPIAHRRRGQWLRVARGGLGQGFGGFPRDQSNSATRSAACMTP